MLSWDTIAAAVIGILLLIWPYLFFNFTGDLFNKFELFDKLSYNMCLIMYTIPTTSTVICTLTLIEKVVILSSVIVILTFVLFKAFKNYKFESTGSIIIYKPLEVVFKIWAAISVGVIFPDIISNIITGYGIRNAGIAVGLIAISGTAVVAYIIISGIMNKRN